MPVKDQNELQEFPLRGPFAGIQSELPPEVIEQVGGFSDAVNMLFYKGEVRVRPAAQPLPPQPVTLNPLIRIMDLVGRIMDQTWSPASLAVSKGDVEPWTGVADFFNVDGNRIQVMFTPTRMFQWVSQGWSQVAGGLTGLATSRIAWSVCAEKLCFCDGISKVQVWDGKTTNFADASVDAVPAKYMFELVNHLIVGNTIEGGSRAYQRIRWCAAGDTTDWTGPNAGQTDLFNDLGPINGCCKLFQYGYIFQQKGIVQVIPTGVGTAPFYFQPLSAASKGLTCPYSLAVNGETQAIYVGKDNVYSFDGTTSTPIGDAPFGNSMTTRKGARRRIFADLMMTDPNTVWGYVSTSINGNPYNAYWLVIPNVATWVYNFDEQNWTRFTWLHTLNVVGTFQQQGPIRIMDLVGTIAQQMWSPASLLNTNPFDSVFLGFGDSTPCAFDFTGWSEADWWIETGQMCFGDLRHEKTIKKLRMVYRDYGTSTILIKITNERGQVWVPNYITTDTPTATLIGSNTGRSREELFMPSIAGVMHMIRIYGAPEQPFAFCELTPIFSVGGEQRYNGNISQNI